MYIGTYLTAYGEMTVDGNAIGNDKYEVQTQLLHTVLKQRYPTVSKQEVANLINDALQTSNPTHFLSQVDAQVIEVSPTAIAQLLPKLQPRKEIES